MFQEYNSFPEGTDIHECLDLYFQSCSMEVNQKRPVLLVTIKQLLLKIKPEVRPINYYWHLKVMVHISLDSNNTIYRYIPEWQTIYSFKQDLRGIRRR